MSRIHRLLRKPFFGGFEVPWIWTTGVAETQREPVEITSGNGAGLRGLWGAAQGEAMGSLVLAHPMGDPARSGKAARAELLVLRRVGHTFAYCDVGR